MRRTRKLGTAVANGVVALMFLLGAGAARAFTVMWAAAILAMLAAPAAHAQSFQPDDDPFFVNTFTDGFQELADVARTSTGFAVVWESDAEFNEAIFGQLFDDTGNRIGNEFVVSLAETSQTEAAVASRAGGFVAVWQSANEDNIIGQLFDAQGARVGDQGVVNTYKDDLQEFPAIASDAQGNFVVVYESFKWPGDGDGDAIVGQLFSNTAVRLSGEFLVNTVREDDQENPSVGRQPGGDFLVAWESDDINNTGIFAQIFDADGAKQGPQFEVPIISEGDQDTPDVGAWPGGYVVAWESDDEEGKGIYARRFDSNGDALGDQFLVNTIQDLDQKFPAVSVFDGGEFLITWQDDDLGVFFQEFDANGIEVGGQIQVNIGERIEQRPRIALRDDGFLVTWFGAGSEADDDIFGRSYSVPEPGATALGLAALSTLAAITRMRKSRS